MNENHDAAQQHIETALNLDPEFQQAEILLVTSKMQKGDFDGALAAAKEFHESRPGEVAPLNLLGRVYLAAGQTENAREAFGKAVALDAGDPAASLQLAQLALEQGDIAAARAQYATILRHHKDFLPALLQLSALDLSEGNEDAMVARLEQAIASHPEKLEPRLVLARYYLSKGKADRVKAIFASLSDIQKQSPPVLQLTALAQLADNQHSDALVTLEELVDATPGSAPSHYQLGIAAAGAGDMQRAETELKRALEIDPNFAPSLAALAQSALAKDSTDELNEYLNRLIAIAPNVPEVLQLQAAAAHRQGDANAATGFASAAFEASPSTRTVTNLSFYLLAAGKRAEARTALSAWLTEHPEDTSVRMALANDQQLGNDVAGAMANYETILRNNPDNVIALNNLAWHLQESDLEQALIYARRAQLLAPGSAEVLDTLGVLEHRNGDSRRGLRYVQRALEIAQDQPSMLYHSAMIQAESGDRQAAIATLQHLDSLQGVSYPEQAEAQALRSKLNM
jgi:putative PEP-CTERM system TPR-repeat lipoprotein